MHVDFLSFNQGHLRQHYKLAPISDHL